MLSSCCPFQKKHSQQCLPRFPYKSLGSSPLIISQVFHVHSICFNFLHFHRKVKVPLMYQSNRSFNILPPRHLNYWKSFVQIPPSPGRKAVQMPPPAHAFRGGVRAYFLNSGWESSLENYCLHCKNNFNIFTYLKIDIN